MFYYANSMYISFNVLFYVEKYKIAHYLYIKARLFSKIEKFKIIIKKQLHRTSKKTHNIQVIKWSF